MLLAFAFLLSMLTAPTPSPEPASCDKNTMLPYGQPIGLNMQVLDGPDFRLQVLQGKPVAINIFATWCGPCNEEMPALLEMVKRYGDRVVFIGMSFEEADDTIRAFRKRYGITYPIAMDRRGGFVPQLGRDAKGDIVFPQTLFFNTDGTLNCYRAGDMDKTEWTQHLDELLLGNP